MHLQDLILTLQNFWASRGCLVVQPYNSEVGAGTYNPATFLRALNAGEVPFFTWGWTADYADAFYYLSQVWHSKSRYNRARYVNATYDKLIDEAQETADEAQRFKLYAAAEKALMEDWGSCGLFVRTSVALAKPNVTGVTLMPMRLLPFDKVEIK